MDPRPGGHPAVACETAMDNVADPRPRSSRASQLGRTGPGSKNPPILAGSAGGDGLRALVGGVGGPIVPLQAAPGAVGTDATTRSGVWASLPRPSVPSGLQHCALIRAD